MISQCFIFNNSTSLPWGTVKTQVLSTRNPKSKKSQYTARSQLVAPCPIKEWMGASRKNSRNKNGQRNGSGESRSQKPHCCVHWKVHLHPSSDMLFEMKHFIMWLCSKAVKHHLKTIKHRLGRKCKWRPEVAFRNTVGSAAVPGRVCRQGGTRAPTTQRAPPPPTAHLQLAEENSSKNYSAIPKNVSPSEKVFLPLDPHKALQWLH